MTVQVFDRVVHARGADLPRTPIGKVQKFKRREMLAAGAVRA